MQKSEIADSVSLLTGCTAIFDFYTAKAVHEQVAKRIANVACNGEEHRIRDRRSLQG